MIDRKYKRKEYEIYKKKEHENCKNIINVDVNCCDHKKNEKDNYKKHDDCCYDHKKDEKDNYKKHDDCCYDHKKRDNSCCRLERRVNNLTNDINNFPRITQSETSLAYFKDFILYGFNDSNDAIGGPGNFSFSGFAFSNDLGKTWTDGGSIPVNPGGLNAGDPVIAVDRNGVFYYGQVGTENIPGGIRQDVISVSTGTINPDGGITMHPPQIVGRGQIPPVMDDPDEFLQDKEWITVGPDADNPGNEALYIAWTDFTTPTASILFSKYTTGVNLTPIITNQVIVPPAANTFVSGSFVVVDDLGGIYVFYEQITDPNPGDAIPPLNILNTPNRTIRMVKSVDGGNTFPINVAVSNPFAAAANENAICGIRPSIGVDNARRIRMNEFPHAAIGPDGTLYVVWNAGRVVDGTTAFIDVFLAYSTNKGNTWNRINVTPDTRTFPLFPTVAANKLGAHVQYNRFNDRGGTLGFLGDGTFAIFMKSFSLCDGLSKEKMVSTAFSPVPVTNPNPDAAPCYMGDYNQIIAGPVNCLFHSWGDNRDVIIQGTIQRDNPDVFFGITVPDQKDHGCDC